MSKSKNKYRRYKNIFLRVENWKSYFLKKIFGFEKPFNFKIKNFEEISVEKKMLGPFRENFLMIFIF